MTITRDLPEQRTAALGTPRPAVVFDVGNTLWFQAKAPDTARIYAAQAERVAPLLAAWSLDVPGTLDGLMQEIWTACETACSVEAERGGLRDPSLPFLIRSTLASRGVEITQQQSEAWWRAAWVLETNFGLQPYPDTIDVLTELKSRGIKIGLNTNRPCTSEMFLPGLTAMGFAPFVDAAVCSGDTGFVKPHPSTFDLILRRLGIAGDEAIMVGDSCEADMAGGRAAQMHTVWKLNGRYDAPPCPHADFAIHELRELLSLPPLA